MYLSRLLLGVIVVMTLAAQSWATEGKAINLVDDRKVAPTGPEVIVNVEIELSFWVEQKPNQERHTVVPKYFEVGQNYPNPFNVTTAVNIDLPTETGVFASIYNILGRRVRILEDYTRSPGRYQLEWDGRTDFGQPATSGFYFFVLLTDDNYAIRKMLLLK